jgi:hypothetical protein
MMVARRHDQASIRGARECRDSALNLAGVTQADRCQLHPERRRHGLDSAQLAKPYGKIPKHRHSRHPRHDLFEQFKPLPAYAVFERSKAGDVAARPGQAIDETGADRVGDNREHDRHPARRLLQCLNAWRCRGQNDVRRER